MKKLFSTVLLGVCAVTLLAGTAYASNDDHDHKSYVCKYVGTPGEDERLQTGQNPIWVDNSALTGKEDDDDVKVGDSFQDQHGRSVVIAYGSQCPPPDCPPSTTTTVVVTTTTVPETTVPEDTTTTVTETTAPETTVPGTTTPEATTTTVEVTTPPTTTVPPSGTLPKTGSGLLFWIVAIGMLCGVVGAALLLLFPDDK